MRKTIFTLFAASFFCTTAFADNGLVTVQSSHDVDTTANKLETALSSKGMTVFARIDHAAGAKNADIDLRPTQVIIFGNPKIGSHLMACSQSTGIDLPQKALIYEDASGGVWLSYNSPGYLSERHSISGCDEVLKKVSGALGKFAQAATQ